MPFVLSAYIAAAIIFPWSFGCLACITMYYLNKKDDVNSGSYMSAYHFIPNLMILIAYVIMFKVGAKTQHPQRGSIYDTRIKEVRHRLGSRPLVAHAYLYYLQRNKRQD